MGFFSARDYSAIDLLKAFARKVGVKLLFLALGWIAIYFGTQLLREGTLMLFNLLVGTVAGLVIGWTLAEDAVQDSGLTGVTLWVVLTLLGGVPILVVESVFYFFTRWEMGFGRWMCITAALIMTMASAVWRASADD